MNIPESNATPRVRLSRERVLRGALQLADAHGLGALTMRGVGEALSVEGMALYKHVANKADLLAGIVDLVLGEVDLPTRGGDWKAEIRRTAMSTFEVLLRHPWACQLLVSGSDGTGPPRWHQMNAVLGTLREGGFSIEMTHHAFHVLDVYVQGFALGTVSFPLDKKDMAAMAKAFLREFPAADHPYMVEHINYHIDTGVLGEGDFEFGLDLLLDSLERLRNSHSGGDSPA
jgi:AcrR family transcriptional regulator